MQASVTDEILRAAQAGEPDALSAVYRAFAPVVAGYLRAKGVADPEATTQDVFVAVLPRIARVTGGVGGLRTLIFSIAHARMVDEHRMRTRRPTTVSYEPEHDVRQSHSADELAESSLSAGRVRQLLEGLPADQRDVLALRFVADLSLEQVARVIGRSVGAVKQLQRRGLASVRSALEASRVPGVTR